MFRVKSHFLLSQMMQTIFDVKSEIFHHNFKIRQGIRQMKVDPIQVCWHCSFHT